MCIIQENILENFILDLLKNNHIKNYAASKDEVRKFYQKNYKSQAGCSFYEFAEYLWYGWYAISLSKNHILFDRAWIDYIRQFLPSPEVDPNKKYVNKNGCQLCPVKFVDENSCKEHLTCEEHNTRLQYLRNKNTFFTKCADLTVHRVENDENMKTIPLTKLKFRQKTNINATLCLTNISDRPYNISKVLQINALNTDLNINVPKLKETLKNGESMNIILNGYFENSTLFLFPIGILAKEEDSKEDLYFLKEITIEVESAYSDLESGIPYTDERKQIFNTFEEYIIPGEKFKTSTSQYKESIRLQSHEIPLWFQQRLTDLIRTYPNFIKRYTTSSSVTANFFNKKFSYLLGITEKLNPNNYCQLLKTLIDIEENQIRFDIRFFDDVSILKHIRGNVYELEVPGLAEARPSLLIGDSVYIRQKPNDFQKYQGIVQKVLQSSVHLGFNSSFSKIFIKNKKFHIEFGYNRRPIRVEKQALDLVRQHEVVSYFYPKAEEIEMKNYNLQEPEISFYNRSLNEEQKRAVKNILIPKCVPYLIFGPPGTGKTVTVVESVLQIWKNYPTSRIIICAPSNAATNEIAVRLVDKIPNSEILRLFGNNYSGEKHNEKLAKITKMQADGSYYMPSMEELLKYRVLLTTLVTAARVVNGGVPQGHYSHVFIDESGYATEAESLLPIAGILSSAKLKGKITGQIVLAGDPRQLGPVIHSNFVRYLGYAKSMLERLLDTCKLYARNEENSIPYNPKYVTKLLKNYRSQENILKIPNRLFYHNELQAADTEMSNVFNKWEHLKTENFPVIFHNVQGEDKRENSSPSFFNTQEIEEVMNYLQKLVKTRVNGMEITEDHIGIITPYRKQAELLRKACGKHSWNKILVGSVEQFQGREKLVVIVSTVRSKNAHKFEDIDKKCQLGFLRNPKRFNVSLTRAKALLIVVGNARVLKTDKNWCSFVRYCLDNKSVAGKAFEFSDDEENLEENADGEIDEGNEKEEKIFESEDV